MHHTKMKADLGLAKVIADLVSKGCIPCIPLSEHQPYDLVIVMPDGRVLKIQVKYASLKKNGIVDVKFRTSWTDKNGTHSKRYERKDFDYYAIYCPEMEKIVYILNSVACPKVIRFKKSSNNQKKNIKWADDYFNIV